VANGLLELIPVGSREMGGLVELDRAQGILAEHAVDDTDVEVEVSVEGNYADCGRGRTVTRGRFFLCPRRMPSGCNREKGR